MGHFGQHYFRSSFSFGKEWPRSKVKDVQSLAVQLYTRAICDNNWKWKQYPISNFWYCIVSSIGPALKIHIWCSIYGSCSMPFALSLLIRLINDHRFYHLIMSADIFSICLSDVLMSRVCVQLESIWTTKEHITPFQS